MKISDSVCNDLKWQLKHLEMLQKTSISNKCCFEKMCYSFYKILSKTTVYNSDDIYFFFLSTKLAY